MIFLFIHGTFGSPSEAWFPWLKKELETLGHEVIAPQFPTDDWEKISKLTVEEFTSNQSLSSWMEVFEGIYPELKNRTDVSIVGHSMGTVFSLHIAERHAIKFRHVYFVAPFLYPATAEELKNREVALIDNANKTFYKKDFDFDFIRKYIADSVAVYSDDDPYIQEREALEFAQNMGSSVIKLSGLGHMGTESGMKTFPQLLDVIRRDI